MALKHTTGDLLKLARKGKFNVIVHGCNCQNTFGKGIALEIKRRYPAAYAADKQTKAGDRNKLGTYTVMLGKLFNIVNAYTQYHYNRGADKADLFEYEAFQQVLDALASQYPICKFGFPMIGCGLAGGDEERIMLMLEDFAEKVERTGGTVTLVKYDAGA